MSCKFHILKWKCGAPNDGGATTSMKHHGLKRFVPFFVTKNFIHGHDFSQWFISIRFSVFVSFCVALKNSCCITIDFATSYDNTMPFHSAYSSVWHYIGKCWRTRCNEGNSIDTHCCIRHNKVCKTASSEKNSFFIWHIFYSRWTDSMCMCLVHNAHCFETVEKKWRTIMEWIHCKTRFAVWTFQSACFLFPLFFSLVNSFNNFSNRKMRCKLIIKKSSLRKIHSYEMAFSLYSISLKDISFLKVP